MMTKEQLRDALDARPDARDLVLDIMEAQQALSDARGGHDYSVVQKARIARAAERVEAAERALRAFTEKDPQA